MRQLVIILGVGSVFWFLFPAQRLGVFIAELVLLGGWGAWRITVHYLSNEEDGQ